VPEAGIFKIKNICRTSKRTNA